MQVCEEALKVLRASRKRPVKGILYITGDSLRVVDKDNKVRKLLVRWIDFNSILLGIGRRSNHRESFVLCARPTARERICLHLQRRYHAPVDVLRFSRQKNHGKKVTPPFLGMVSYPIFSYRANGSVTRSVAPLRFVWRRSRNAIERPNVCSLWLINQIIRPLLFPRATFQRRPSATSVKSRTAIQRRFKGIRFATLLCKSACRIHKTSNRPVS